ncbi:MAG: hypothetical protein JNL11_03795 [Bdellovibrionaceae bacterium]|nr:hypothetical protein [Pseudobdellovibrionaceae bacterium]
MILISTLKNWIICLLLIMGSYCKADVLRMKVFTFDSKILGTAIVQVPTAPGQRLVVQGILYKCEIDSLNILSKNTRLRMSFLYEPYITTFNGSINLSEPFSVSLDNRYSCQLEWIDAN